MDIKIDTCSDLGMKILFKKLCNSVALVTVVAILLKLEKTLCD